MYAHDIYSGCRALITHVYETEIITGNVGNSTMLTRHRQELLPRLEKNMPQWKTIHCFHYNSHHARPVTATQSTVWNKMWIEC